MEPASLIPKRRPEQLWEILHFFLPAPERDPKFREYLTRISRPALQTVAAVEIAIPILIYLARLAVGPTDANSPDRIWQMLATVSVGVVTMVLARIQRVLQHARLLAALSAWAASAALISVSFASGAGQLSMDDYIPVGITLILLTVVASTPMRPVAALMLGLSVEGVYLTACLLAMRASSAAFAENSDAHHIFLVLLAFLIAGIAGSNYEHRRIEYEAQQNAVRVAESLAGAQLRAQLAESAISIGKMAAALSHEFNSPVGALRSSISTLITMSERLPEASEEQRKQLYESRNELYRSIRESAARIDDVIVRLRRFASLVEADLKAADINDLLSDVAMLYREQLEAHHIRIEFHLQRAIPTLLCRPQLLSAVFSSLLSNAINAIEDEGMISISTRLLEDSVEVTIRDNGRGMTPEQADNVFEPTFTVNGARVASANWSLFNTRQIVYEHGGEIRIETAEGKGTAVSVTLPVPV
ncbi:MAG TPA: ATP-binding protein [Bryobacteraceae bacterium]|nr:ATP-binding protein [Bryobacteraceae bacterium]